MKLKSGAYDGIILAQAGIRRLLDNQAKVDGAGIADDFDYSPFSFIPIDIRGHAACGWAGPFGGGVPLRR